MASRKIPAHLKLAFAHFCADVAEDARACKEGNYRPWTAEEEETLVSMRAAGVEYAKIGEVLNRTTDACLCKHDKLVVRIKRPSRTWTAQEEEALIDMWAEGVSYEDIGKVLDRTSIACQRKMSEINQRPVAKVTGQGEGC